MTIQKAVTLGLAGNEISKKITGSSDSSVGRTAVAVGTGAALGAGAAGAVTVGAAAVGIVAAPAVVPLAIATAVVSGIASLFD